MKITSSAFMAGEAIPVTHTQHGEGSNPPLTITDVPFAATSLVLIVDDPDAPKGTFTHWVVFNIDRNVGVIMSNAVPSGAAQAVNDAGVAGYRGPRPPSGTHRYFFRVYALDCRLPLADGATRAEVEGAIQGHIVATAELMGRFSAPDRAPGPR